MASANAMTHPQKLRLVHKELLKKLCVEHSIKFERCLSELKSRVEVELDALKPSFYHHIQDLKTHGHVMFADDIMFLQFVKIYFNDSFEHGEYSFGRSRWNRLLENAVIMRFSEQYELEKCKKMVQDTLTMIKIRQASTAVATNQIYAY